MGPGTYVMFQGKRLKIHKTKVLKGHGSPGCIHEASANSLVIETPEGFLSLLEVQPESKSKMRIADFLKSVHLKKGDLFV
jgi:methionyl-tRNA formyltransferase